MVELATLTPLVGHGSSATAVVVVGAGAVVVVVDVVTAGLALGVAEQAASTSAAPRRTDAVLREDPECDRRLGNRTCGTPECWHRRPSVPGTIVGHARRTS
jgi:hypothetical protein